MLKPPEKAAILAGETKALRREERPDIKAGDMAVLSWTRGGRQIMDRETGETVDIPRKPTIWIEFKQPELKGDEWIIQFRLEDHRESIRLLAAGAPRGVPSEAGLKTRWRDGEKVPKRGDQIESWTDETERGYGGGGKAGLDSDEGVDDLTLREFAVRSRESFAEHRQEIAEEEETKRQARAVRSEVTEALSRLTSVERVAWLAKLQKMCDEVRAK